MSTTVVTLVVLAAAVVLLAVLVYGAVRKRRSQRLHEQFGPEYGRTQERLGSRRQAERHLIDVRDRRQRVQVRPLTSDELERYQSEWYRVQATFVDLPAEAVAEADLLVSRIMRDRGYPVDDFEERADMVAADHPGVVEHYRFAHAVRVRQAQGTVDTETLREALVHYRALAEHLLDPRQAAAQAPAPAQSTPAPQPNATAQQPPPSEPPRQGGGHLPH